MISQVAAQNNAADFADAAATQAVGIPQPGTTRRTSQGHTVQEDVPNVARRPSPQPTTRIPAPTRERSVTVQATPTLSEKVTSIPRFSPEDTRPSTIPIAQRSSTPPRRGSQVDGDEARAAKRQRVDTVSDDTGSRAADAAGEAQASLPGGEAEEISRDIVMGPAAPSQIYSQPIRQSIEMAQPGKTKKPRISKQAKARKQAINAAAAAIVADAVGERPRTGRKTKKSLSTRPAEAGEAQQTTESVAADVVNGAVKAKRPKKKRKKREETPEGAEYIEIVPSQITMSELTSNARIGRRSERDKELQLMEEAEKAKKKLAKKKARDGTTVEPPPPQDEGPAEAAEERLERLARERCRSRSPSIDRAVPNTIIVNGQIQLDESTLVIDRHARAARAREAVAEDPIDENELSRRINSSTWLKVDKSGGWNEVLTDQFYDGLRMFGTDFYMISKMFPGRTRHSVKLKFNKEERLNAWKIEATLKGEKLPVNMDEYSKASNTVFSDPKDLEREMDEDRKRIEEEEEAAKAALAEAERERAEQAAREAAAAEEESSGKENEANATQPGGYVTRNMKRKQLRQKAREEYKEKLKKRKKSANSGATSGGVTS